jgi:hypothetical protein
MNIRRLAVAAFLMGELLGAAEPVADAKIAARDPKITERSGWKLVWSDEFDVDGPPL